ncbi:hypothetical protein GH733_009553 [Mirounga leonina]|nr:hypothetical protein GH733_009553 [Mirounga leonina]
MDTEEEDERPELQSAVFLVLPLSCLCCTQQLALPAKSQHRHWSLHMPECVLVQLEPGSKPLNFTYDEVNKNYVLSPLP